MAVGFRIGITIWKNVWIGVHPSIMAASSISNGILFTKPQNINTESPAPNPRYKKIIPTGLFSFNISASLDMVNMTIWNGTTIENTNRQYNVLLSLVLTLVIYHAVMEVKSTITRTEPTVMNADQPNAAKNPVLRIPSVQFSSPANISPDGQLNGLSLMYNFPLKEFMIINRISSLIYILLSAFPLDVPV